MVAGLVLDGGRRLVVTRRNVVAGLAALASAPAAGARAADFTYKDWRFDTSGIGGAAPEATMRSLQAQVDIVEAVPLKPEVLAFFKSVPMTLAPTTRGGPGAYSFDLHRMILSTAPDPPQNPVFLHELLHAYHDQRLPGRFANPVVQGFYDQAKASGRFPPEAYMLKNRAEFFAMAASVTLWGKAARPPFRRSTVKRDLPAFYAWTLVEFTPTGTEQGLPNP